MNESILTSTKKALNIGTDDTSFDDVIVMHINSILSHLIQMGVGNKGFVLTDSTQTWTNFLDKPNTQQIKSYVYLKVRMLFDPPQNSRVMESMESNAKEMEVRLYQECSEEYNPYG